jgi:hypothetical protein
MIRLYGTIHRIDGNELICCSILKAFSEITLDRVYHPGDEAYSRLHALIHSCVLVRPQFWSQTRWSSALSSWIGLLNGIVVARRHSHKEPIDGGSAISKLEKLIGRMQRKADVASMLEEMANHAAWHGVAAVSSGKIEGVGYLKLRTINKLCQLFLEQLLYYSDLFIYICPLTFHSNSCSYNSQTFTLIQIYKSSMISLFANGLPRPASTAQIFLSLFEV